MAVPEAVRASRVEENSRCHVPNFEEHVFVPLGLEVDAHGNHPILREIAIPIEFKDRNLRFHCEPDDTCSQGAGTIKKRFRSPRRREGVVARTRGP